jgi:hypothetical protein
VVTTNHITCASRALTYCRDKQILQYALYRWIIYFLTEKLQTLARSPLPGPAGNAPPCSRKWSIQYKTCISLRRFDSWKFQLRIRAHTSLNITIDFMLMFMALVKEQTLRPIFLLGRGITQFCYVTQSPFTRWETSCISLNIYCSIFASVIWYVWSGLSTSRLWQLSALGYRHPLCNFAFICVHIRCVVHSSSKAFGVPSSLIVFLQQNNWYFFSTSKAEHVHKSFR